MGNDKKNIFILIIVIILGIGAYFSYQYFFTGKSQKDLKDWPIDEKALFNKRIEESDGQRREYFESENGKHIINKKQLLEESDSLRIKQKFARSLEELSRESDSIRELLK